MHRQQKESSDESSDDSMDHPISMKIASSRRRSSTEEPPDIADDILEFTRLHKVLPECNTHVDNMNKLVTEFEKDYSRTTYSLIGAGVGIAVGILLSYLTAGLSAIAAGIAVATFGTVFGQFKKEQQEKNVRKSFEDELTQLQTKISPMIDMLEKLSKRTQEILRDSSIPEHKANALRERLSFCFNKIKIRVGAPMSESEHMSKHISEIFTEMNSLLDILKEIVEEEPDDNPTETSTHKQIDESEFKEKAEKFIKEMKSGICQVQNVINEIDQINKRIARRFH